MRCELELNDQNIDIDAVKGGIRKVNAAHLHDPTITGLSNERGIWHTTITQSTKC
jgi:hypothetical protein